jgi:hypothetical protein
MDGHTQAPPKPAMDVITDPAKPAMDVITDPAKPAIEVTTGFGEDLGGPEPKKARCSASAYELFPRGH